MSKLTVVHIRAVKPKSKSYKLSEGHGMHLHVSKSDLMTWRYRYRAAGKESTFTLGEYPKMSLADASKARMDARELVRQGVNPAQARRQKRQEELEKQLSSDAADEYLFKNIAFEWVDQQCERWSKNMLML